MNKFNFLSLMIALSISFFGGAQAYETTLGEVTQNFRASQSVNPGARSVWVDGMQAGTVRSGDQVTISADGTRAVIGAETRQVDYVTVKAERTRITFTEALNNNHSDSAVARIDYRPIVEEGTALGMAYGNLQLTISNIAGRNAIWLAGDQSDRLEVKGKITLTDGDTGYINELGVLNFSVIQGNTLVRLEEAVDSQIANAQVSVEETAVNSPGRSLGVARGAAVREASVRVGTHILWFHGKQQNSVASGDTLILGEGEQQEELEVVDVLVLGNTTRVSLSTGVENNHVNAVAQIMNLEVSGSLEISDGSSVAGGNIVVGSNNITVKNIRITASDNEVRITDIYLKQLGTATSRDFVAFLYDQNGVLLESESVIEDRLHFELGRSSEIHLNPGETALLSVRVEINNITRFDNGGKTIQLAFDQSEESNGVQAFTPFEESGNELNLERDSVVNNTSTGSLFTIVEDQQ